MARTAPDEGFSEKLSISSKFSCVFSKNKLLTGGRLIITPTVLSRNKFLPSPKGEGIGKFWLVLEIFWGIPLISRYAPASPRKGYTALKNIGLFGEAFCCFSPKVEGKKDCCFCNSFAAVLFRQIFAESRSICLFRSEKASDGVLRWVRSEEALFKAYLCR